MAARPAKRRQVDRVRVVVFLNTKSFRHLESLADSNDINRSAVIALALARLHRAEVKQGRLVKESPVNGKAFE